MYESFYHLKENPFGATPDPRFFYKGKAHREALAYLAYGIFRKRGFLAVTGEVGIGKTTVIRSFVQTFYPCLDASFVLNTRVTFEEMLYLSLRDFGCETANRSKVEMLTALNDYLIDKYAMNQNPLLVIDEAQNLTADVLEELRLLSNLETDQHKLIQIVLIGQPELEAVLLRKELRQFRQRIPGILRMHRLSREEVGRYIIYRLRIAGMVKGGVHFSAGAHDAVFEFSEGIPRLINTVCDKVLHRSYLRKQRIIERKAVEASIQELANQVDHPREEWGGLR
ncbi:MAG: AAA family ATPase [Candidatus Latescibacteria bacterium]|nr:AAA family ATPase [Candidatus Latescibacterota bacterium]NIM20891.1 AAA family ATPase [Candidatus Latescibacterota bacterium]NIM65026.1 AAA family ATPase [Candidatus Latescibacterota bacterium]NIO01541.1 AAA family ATPase [Candidatus Latescibacterota bacterium]NIO28058.1 AAA family ATPase [Candidatus Latescibacterota bacterium]